MDAVSYCEEVKLLLTETIPLRSVTLSGPTRFFYPTGYLIRNSFVSLVVVVYVSAVTGLEAE